MKRKSIVLFLTFTVFAFVGFLNPSFAQETARNKGDKEAAEALRLALSTYDFTEFSSLLSDECTLVVADCESITGADNIVSYLRKFCLDDFRPSIFSSLELPSFKVVTTPYNFTPALWIVYFDNSVKYGEWRLYYVVFRMEHGMVADMYLAENESSIINRKELTEEEYIFGKKYPYAYYWSRQLPYSPDIFKLDSSNRIAARSNAMPCMECGMKSELLEWYSVKRFVKYVESPDDYVYFDGEVSVCPHCGHIVQYLESEEYTLCDAQDVGVNISETDTIKIESDNDFAQKGILFQALIKQINDEWKKNNSVSQDNVDEVMNRLDALRLPDEGNLYLRLPFGSEIGDEKYRLITGSQSELRVCINGEQQPSYYGNVFADTTRMGAWQLFLLANANKMLPAEENGISKIQDFIFCEAQLLAKQQMKKRDVSNLLEKYPIEPQITMSKCKVGGETKFIADIQCYFREVNKDLMLKTGRIVMGIDGCFERYIVMGQVLLHCDNENADRIFSSEQGFTTYRDNGAAEALRYALSTYDFSYFTTYLADSTTLLVYDECYISGIDNIISYMRNLCKDSTLPNVESLGESQFSVFLPPYNFNEALSIRVWDYSVLEKTWWALNEKCLIFKMKDDKLANMVLADKDICCYKYGYDDRDSHLWAQQLSFSLGSLEFDDREGIEAKVNALPCMECGLKSEELDWYSAWRFDYYDEESDSCSFVVGKVSICPHCGSMVQWIEDSLVQSKPKNLKKYLADNDLKGKSVGNVYAQKGTSYIAAVEQINKKWMNDKPIPQSVLDNVMKQLDALHYPEDGKLDFCMKGFDDDEDVSAVMNANYELRVRINGKSTPSLYGNVYADTTCMGAWQLFLLANAEHVLPSIWHGGYKYYDYVFCEKDLYGIRELEDRDISKLVENYPIGPRISMLRNKVGGETKIFADIYCCHWNDWEGLALDHYRVVMGEDGCFERIFTMSQTILHRYNCGIMF